MFLQNLRFAIITIATTGYLECICAQKLHLIMMKSIIRMKLQAPDVCEENSSAADNDCFQYNYCSLLSLGRTFVHISITWQSFKK